MTKKICRWCETPLNEDDFYNTVIGTKDSVCKHCRNERAKERYKNENGREKCRLKQEAYYKNPEKRAEKNKRHQEHYTRHIVHYWAKATKANHERNGIEVRLSCQELEHIASIHQNCMLCGVPLWWGRKPKGVIVDTSPTVDRLNNESYIDSNNIFIVCHKCNKTKQNRTMKEFIDYCISIGKRFGKVD